MVRWCEYAATLASGQVATTGSVDGREYDALPRGQGPVLRRLPWTTVPCDKEHDVNGAWNMGV